MASHQTPEQPQPRWKHKQAGPRAATVGRGTAGTPKYEPCLSARAEATLHAFETPAARPWWTLFFWKREPATLVDVCRHVNRVRRQQAEPKSHSLASAKQSVMILPQVHLRKPCYDFYFLQAIEFERLLGQQSDACTSDRDQSEVLTEPLNR